ncbi:MAG: hypothetical protein P4L57_08270 [Rhizomicrobium sp.]|nr:hypothetical protein [Rhizomicrobium sp.]
MPKNLKLFLLLAAVIFAASLYVAMVGSIGLALRNYYPGTPRHGLVDWGLISAALFDVLSLVVTLLLAGLAVRPRCGAARAMFMTLTVYSVLVSLPSAAYLIIKSHGDFSGVAQITAIIGRSEVFRFVPYVATALPLLQLSAMALLFTGAARRWFETARPDVVHLNRAMPLAVKLVAVACLLIALGWIWNYWGRAAISAQLAVGHGRHPGAAADRLWALGLLIVKLGMVLALGALLAFWRRAWVGWAGIALLGNVALYGLFTDAFVLPVLIKSAHDTPGLPLYAVLSPYVVLAAVVLCGVGVLLLLLPGSRQWFETVKCE